VLRCAPTFIFHHGKVNKTAASCSYDGQTGGTRNAQEKKRVLQSRRLIHKHDVIHKRVLIVLTAQERTSNGSLLTL
jgi:hypothetical protein